MLQRARSILLAHAVLAALAPFAGRADETMRCGNALIVVGMVASQVVAKCGPPKDKHAGADPQRARRGSGSGGTGGAARVERWTYDRGYAQFPALLTFQGGKLKSIDLLTSR